jgi:Flp pilus assembly protein TadG
MAGLAARYFWIALMRSGATAISFAMVIVLLFLGYRPWGGLEI